MSYTVTISNPNDISVSLSSISQNVTLSQVGQQGASGPTGITWESAWVTSTSYQLNDVVSNNGSSYICILAHTSSSSDEPGVGVNTTTYWEVLALKGTDGTGTGTVTSIDITGGTGITSTGGPITSSGSITVALDSATQTSLGLADSALQSGDNISVLTNDSGYQVEADVETATVNAQTGTTYTLALTDRGQVVTMDNASANTVTIPTNSSVSFDTGSVVTIIQKGSGVTTVTGDTGVTVNGTSGGSVSIADRYQGVSLLKVGTDTWIASGAV